MNISVPPAATRPAPVLRVTFYDRISAFLMAIVLGLCVVVLGIIALWQRVGQPMTVGPRLVEFVPAADSDDSAPQTLEVTSPEAFPYAEPVDPETDARPFEERVTSVIALAEAASRHVQQPVEFTTTIMGAPGSAGDGTGTGLGEEFYGDGNPPARRWFIQFREGDSIEDYAAQLDYFGIELGLLRPDHGELLYLSDLSDESPTTRVVTTGDDQRLYMSWQGEGRHSADVELFRRAGIDVADGGIYHFYPADTEELLVRLESSFAQRPVEEIRRTYFVVVRQGAGYTFVVTRQHRFR